MLFIIVTLIGCKERDVNVYDIDEITIVNNIAYLKNDMLLVTGKVRGEDNDQLLGEMNFKDGNADGVWKTWYENGQLEREINFRMEKKMVFGKSGMRVDS
ncbi:hypothetical protein JYT76_01930 [Olleya sp. AH-315-F22]|nr:hypothetical protein [Olleya sp. AH-315-F22]